MNTRIRNAWNALMGRPVIVFHDGGTLDHATVHGSIRLDGSGIAIRNSQIIT